MQKYVVNVIVPVFIPGRTLAPWALFFMSGCIKNVTSAPVGRAENPPTGMFIKRKSSVAGF